MAVDSKRVKAIFTEAAEIPDRAARRQLLDRECGVDAELRRRIEVLLDAFDAPKPELEQPLARVLADPDPTTTRNGNGNGKAATSQLNASDRPNMIGQIIAGKYKLRQLIGEGGMGSVYLAEQLQPIKRQVALKLVKDNVGSNQILIRFEAERQALAMMDHPNIAKVLDAGTVGSEQWGVGSEEGRATSRLPTLHSSLATSSQPYFVMELVKGVPITQFCDEHRLSVSDRLDLFRQVCHAVNHAHQKGVIHRDLKPTNILVEDHDGKPVPKVIDFGLAKAIGGLTLTEETLFSAMGFVAGTPLYMAPEQATFNAIDIDTRADVYALGVVLYELLTGSTPIARETLKKIALDEMLRVIREKEPQSPSHRISSSEMLPSIAATRQSEPAKLGRFVRGELDWIAMKALAKERDRRYDSAMAFAHDIERFLNHEPVDAGPPSKIYRMRKFVRRNRTGVIAATLVLLALVVGVIGTSVGMVRANNARLAETEQRQIAVEERRAAQAVNDFLLKDLLAQASTRQQEKGVEARDPDIKVRTILDRSAERISARFKDQPITEATVRLLIGQTYRLLTQYPAALPLTQRAFELREQHLGPDHPDTLDAAHALGLVHYEMGKPQLAEPLLERARVGLKAARGAEHPESLTAASSLAKLYIGQGKYLRAEPLNQEVLEARRRLLGDDDPDTLTTKLNLALIYKETEQYVKAESLYRDVIAAGTAKLGADHPSVVFAQNNLGMLLRSLGKFDLAEEIFKQILDTSKSKLAEDDIEALTARIYLGATYLPAGRPREAVALLERAIAVGMPKLGPENVTVLMAKSMLATAYRMVSDFDKSEALFRELIATRTATVGAEHPATLADKNAYAQLLRARGKLAEAEQLLRAILAVEVGKFGSDSKQTLATRTNLGMTYVAMKDGVRAEPILRGVLAGRIQSLGDDHPTTLSAKSNLADAFMLQKKYAEAVPLLVAEYDGLKRFGKAMAESARKARQSEDLNRLIKIADSSNRAEEAKKWRAERAKLMPNKSDPLQGGKK